MAGISLAPPDKGVKLFIGTSCSHLQTLGSYFGRWKCWMAQNRPFLSESSPGEWTLEAELQRRVRRWGRYCGHRKLVTDRKNARLPQFAPSGRSNPQEIRHQFLPLICQHTFGMKLHSFEGKFPVTQTHDHPSPIAFAGPRADLKFVRQLVFRDDQ